MVDETEGDVALFPERVGDKLRAARTKAGLDLSDIASRTRIPLRHLTAIEAGDYQALPAKTYAMGFVKAFARAIGADEVALARELRGELGLDSGNGTEYSDYDTADPARVPPRLLAWTAVAVALLIALGYAGWRQGWFDRSAEPDFAAEEVVAAPALDAPSTGTAPAATAAPAGDVVLTATDTVWLRIYDATDAVLKQGEMKPGESFTVPATANKPMIRVGQPQLIKVSIGGREVAPLGDASRLVKDLEISAAALNARPAPVATPSATSAASSIPAAPIPSRP